MRLLDEKVRSIAVLRPAGLGDFIMSSPAFVALRKRFPAARITLVTMYSQDVAQAEKVGQYAGPGLVAPWIDLLRPHAIDDVIVLPPMRGGVSLLRAWREARGVAPDLIVHMFDPGAPYVRRLLKIGFMLMLFGPVRQIGWRQKGQILSGKPPSADPRLGHHVLGPLQFLRELDHGRSPEPEDVEFDIRAGAAAEIWAKDWTDEHRRVGRRIVAIAPGAIHDHKQWPIEKFKDVVKRISEVYPDILFVIVGTAKDASLAAELRSGRTDQVLDLCGKTTISQSAALFRYCSLVVGNDGGAMHLADAVGAKVVSVVPGLEYPTSVEPWHNQDRAVRLTVPCAPCYSFTYCPQGHRRCMLALPLEPVLFQCLQALSHEGHGDGCMAALAGDRVG